LLAASISHAQLIKEVGGLCYGPTAPQYDAITDYVAYPSMEACVGYDVVPQSTGAFPDDTPFKLEYFGDINLDSNRNCQTDRTYFLAYTSRKPLVFTDRNECAIKRGEWVTDYSKVTVTDPKRLVLEPLIPPKWAWEHGANRWTTKQRQDFLHDYAYMAVLDPNMAKARGDKGYADWRPFDDTCKYIELFDEARRMYSLSLFAGEAKRVKELMERCKRGEEPKKVGFKLLPENSIFNISFEAKKDY